MSWPRALQLLGLVMVTWVMIRSYFHEDMLFQFGGLGLGAAVFLLGKWVEQPAEG